MSFDETYFDNGTEDDPTPFILDLICAKQQAVQSSESAIPDDLMELEHQIDNPDIEVTIGPKSTSTRQVVKVDCTNLSVGHMVALFQTEIYNSYGHHLPIIGKVTRLESDETDRQWVYVALWQGHYNTNWIGPKKPAVECITSDAVILFDFAFTNKGHLQSNTIKELKKRYNYYTES